MDKSDILTEHGYLLAALAAGIVATIIFFWVIDVCLECIENRMKRKETAKKEMDAAASPKDAATQAATAEADKNQVESTGSPITMMRIIIRHIKVPARALVPLVAIRVVFNDRDLEQKDSSFDAIDWVDHLLTIFAVCWLIICAFDAITELLLSRHRLDGDNTLDARMVHTRFGILNRFISILIILIGVGLAMYTVDSIRSLSASLLALSGVLGLVVALAASPTLSNLFAGLQIAVSQPIRLDDVVVIDGEWGRIEEINASYIVVACWDQRRLIVPFSRITSGVFQNWTRTSTELIGTVFLYVDYSVDVPALRTEFTRALKEQPEWDGRVSSLAVTDCKERTMEVRMLMSAKNSSRTADLRMAMREKMLTFLQKNFPSALSRDRVDLHITEASAVAFATALRLAADVTPDDLAADHDGGAGSGGGAASSPAGSTRAPASSSAKVLGALGGAFGLGGLGRKDDAGAADGSSAEQKKSKTALMVLRALLQNKNRRGSEAAESANPDAHPAGPSMRQFIDIDGPVSANAVVDKAKYIATVSGTEDSKVAPVLSPVQVTSSLGGTSHKDRLIGANGADSASPAPIPSVELTPPQSPFPTPSQADAAKAAPSRQLGEFISPISRANFIESVKRAQEAEKLAAATPSPSQP